MKYKSLLKCLALFLIVSITMFAVVVSVNAYEVLYRQGYSNPPAYLKCYSGFTSETIAAIHNACVDWNSTHSSGLVYRLTSTHSSTVFPNANGINEITKAYRGEDEYLMSTNYTSRSYADGIIYEADIDINVSHDFGTASTSYNTQTVIAHEIGHVLGLGHSSNTSALMYKSISKGEVKDIHSDDIAGIAAIY